MNIFIVYLIYVKNYLYLYNNTFLNLSFNEVGNTDRLNDCNLDTMRPPLPFVHYSLLLCPVQLVKVRFNDKSKPHYYCFHAKYKDILSILYKGILFLYFVK